MTVWASLISVRKLQLSVKKLQLLAPPSLFKPRRSWPKTTCYASAIDGDELIGTRISFEWMLMLSRSIFGCTVSPIYRPIPTTTYTCSKSSTPRFSHSRIYVSAPRNMLVYDLASPLHQSIDAEFENQMKTAAEYSNMRRTDTTSRLVSRLFLCWNYLHGLHACVQQLVDWPG